MAEAEREAGPHRAGAALQVTVRYFAVLRERRGIEEERLALPAGTTVGELYRRLFPPGPEGALPVLFAIDQGYVSRDQVLHDGAEVAFIPPLGGG